MQSVTVWLLLFQERLLSPAETRLGVWMFSLLESRGLFSSINMILENTKL